jgi:O-Antigen ligase
MALLWLLVVLPALYVSPAALDAFRLPKLMLAEWLALASLLPLAWQLRDRELLRWRDVGAQPAVRAVLPLLLVAAAGLLTTRHPEHVRQALSDLWIGGACLVGWSAGLSASRLGRLLCGLLWPAVALAGLGILQFHGVQPLTFTGIRAGSRLAITSTAGNPADLAMFLVLPCLVAQWRLARGTAPSARRGWLVAALAISLYAVALTQTLAALVALLVSSLILWGLAQRGGAGRTRLARLLLAGGAAVVLLAGVVAVVPQLRARAAEKIAAARQGDWGAVLTGRLDGWRTAVWMLSQHPWAGVGQGAYRTEFAPAKLALLDRGVAFHSGQQQNFVNAHDEPLEVAADCGLPGLAALAWAVGVLALAGWQGRSATIPAAASGSGAGGGEGVGHRSEAGRAEAPLPGGAARRAPAPREALADRAFAVAGGAAFAVLGLVDFPFRIALVAFPALLFLAWAIQPAAAAAAAAATAAEPTAEAVAVTRVSATRQPRKAAAR